MSPHLSKLARSILLENYFKVLYGIASQELAALISKNLLIVYIFQAIEENVYNIYFTYIFYILVKCNMPR
jgi:hypothetical protein